MSMQVVFYYFVSLLPLRGAFVCSKVFLNLVYFWFFISSLYSQLVCCVIYDQQSWNSLFVKHMRRRCKACANGMLHCKDSAYGVLIYDVNKFVDWILSFKAWFPVYLNLFYQWQYLRT